MAAERLSRRYLKVDNHASLSADLPNAIDLVLLDGAKGLYSKLLGQLEPHLRPGAMTVADNVDSTPEYLAQVRATDGGYLSVAFTADVELSLRTVLSGRPAPPPPRVPTMTDMNDFNAQIIDEFRANDGVVGGAFAGAPILVLHHTGARSGKEYLNPLVYLPDGDSYTIFASKGGAPTHPAWYHNLRAHPQVTIEVGTATGPVTASEVTGGERDRLYASQAALRPSFGEYEQKTAGIRTIPVIRLTP